MWLTAQVTVPLTRPYPGRVWLAASLAALGIGVIFGGVRAFSAAKTTVNPLEPATTAAIVTGGIYRLTRNPMYLGMLLGWAAFLPNAAAVVFPILFILFITRYHIRPEERTLQSKFGAAYETYLQSVRRWL
jgi:protein-S-isoprenylcysteine O-methyltransferase Ste14